MVSLIFDWVADACCGKPTQTEGARVAAPTRAILGPVARPRQLERCPQLSSALNDFILTQVNHRGHDFDLSFRLRSNLNGPLKRLIKFRTTVGVAGSIFSHSPDINSSSVDGFGPAGGD